MKTFHCNRCQQLVFFENVLCERCNALLGYLPDVGEISAFEPADEPTETAETGETVEEALDRALAQIEEKGYVAEAEAAGADPIRRYGIVFDGKRVRVKAGVAPG